MTRKRLKKLLMGAGYDRNVANGIVMAVNLWCSLRLGQGCGGYRDYWSKHMEAAKAISPVANEGLRGWKWW